MSTKKDTEDTTFVTVRMPNDIVKAVDELSIEAVRSRSAQVIYLLRQALKQEPPAES
jgi:metal-responsive CopG/Arc/MetJ family transcriptional regulator